MNLRPFANYLKENKRWLFLLLAFLSVRVIVFISFWNSSQSLGGWQNFYLSTDLWYNALEYKNLFRSLCGGLPLYFTFTSLAQLFIDGHWGIYMAQTFAVLIVLFFSYQLIKLFFSSRIAYYVVLIMAIDPYLAWFNFIIASENLFFVFFVAGVYYFLKFLKQENRKSAFLFSLFFSLAAITRTNAIFFSLLFSVLLLFFYFIRTNGFYILKNIRLGNIVKTILFFNLTFAIFCGGVMLLNKHDHNDYRMDAAFSSNVYYFNVPALYSQIKETSFSEAKDQLIREASNDLGFDVSMLNCMTMGKENYNKLLDYASLRGKEIVAENLFAYTRIHLFKMIPFFLQSTYYNMYEVYTGRGDKPDVSSALLKGDIYELKEFFNKMDLGLFLYLGGMLLWLIISFSVFFSAIYSFLRDKERFPLFFLILILILYSAFVVSPFSMPRYKLTLYPFFIIAFIYFIQIVLKKIRAEKLV